MMMMLFGCCKESSRWQEGTVVELVGACVYVCDQCVCVGGREPVVVLCVVVVMVKEEG